MKKAKPQQNKLIRILTMPLRTLSKARDFYVRSMNNHSTKLCYGGSGWGATAYADPLPRRFSTNSCRPHEKDDLKELIRAASTSTLGNKFDHLGSSKLRTVSRSTSVGVGMGKIEEDKPCEFNDNDVMGINFRVDHGKTVKVFDKTQKI